MRNWWRWRDECGTRGEAAGEFRREHDAQGAGNTGPEPDRGSDDIDPHAHERAPDHPSDDPPEPDDAIQALRFTGRHAVVQEREEGRDHERAEQIAEQIERPHRGIRRLAEDHAIPDEARDEERAEDVDQSLSLMLPCQPREHDHGGKRDHHVEDLRDQFRLGRGQVPRQQGDARGVELADERRLLERLQYPECRNDQKEARRHGG
ncbi:MAG: hypothetical protein H0V80_17475 [Acidobacteria bacterium]|nr:hypothetical protein [Acidobacteriota bacterium]